MNHSLKVPLRWKVEDMVYYNAWILFMTYVADLSIIICSFVMTGALDDKQPA